MDMIEKSLIEIAKNLNDANNVTVLTGAGVSTASGVPDFRSIGGLYDNYQVEELLTPDFFNNKPELFWRSYKELFKTKLTKDLIPNYGHIFLVELERMGKEVSVFTQNIDGLHQKAGSSKVYELHGSLRMAVCPKCKSEFDRKFINSVEVPNCPKDNFTLKPDVVLFGEPIRYFDHAYEQLMLSDVLLVLGSSLEVYPVSQLPSFVARSSAIRKVLINNEKTRMDRYFDICLYGDISKYFQLIRCKMNNLPF
jgi:NAD-dependent deacetylase